MFTPSSASAQGRMFLQSGSWGVWFCVWDGLRFKRKIPVQHLLPNSDGFKTPAVLSIVIPDLIITLANNSFQGRNKK
jgi:hypothetical protein